MDNLTIESSNKTPYCYLNKTGKLEFSGISMPEDDADSETLDVNPIKKRQLKLLFDISTQPHRVC